MTSARQRRANRANSLRSTGPKTVAGRSKSARNAFRHGLRIPVLSDPQLRREVEALADKIAGGAGPEQHELALRIAEAEVDLLRIRRKRQSTFCDLRRSTLAVAEAEPSQPAQDFVVNLARRSCSLAVLDRYERRALSRRKFAIRAFDAARAEARLTGQPISGVIHAARRRARDPCCQVAEATQTGSPAPGSCEYLAPSISTNAEQEGAQPIATGAAPHL